MSQLVARIRAACDAGDHEDALAIAIGAWRDRRAAALADVVDAIDRLVPPPSDVPATRAWLAMAAAADTHVARGALLRTATTRSAADLVACCKRAGAWDDPRLGTHLAALLAALPFSGTRTREAWRAVFDIAAALHDPRFLALADTLPATWNVGPDMKRWLGNRLAEANADVAAVELPAGLAPALVALAGELRGRVVVAKPAITEESLLAAIYDSPDDDGPRLVYADWLQEKGDPRGELIALQLRPASALDAAAHKRVKQLVKAHGKAWLGALAPVLGGVEFRRGFPAKGIVKFRHQRDAEQHGAHRAWATLEELEFGGQVVRHDQRVWAHHVSEAMTNLRIVRSPAVAPLLAATRPWQIESLAIGGYGQEIDEVAFRAVCGSPLLARVVTLTVSGELPPHWLAGLARCPAHLAIGRAHDRRETAAMLAAAEASPLARVSFHRWVVEYAYARGASGAFDRLDVVIAQHGNETHPEDLERVLPMVADLAAGSLEHLDAWFQRGSERVPLPDVVRAGRRAVRG